ncbi:hypothetical protein NDR87_30260 [Nocardia sp. CDC159]|uniref:Uncharacterized protein n=1 Tax=Nocardia pulmonis TaxID=2951408 RepID=A0A9X2EBG2_9NOCA|nr:MULTISPECIES: hypothetical protein [Nocardia]MCM6777777.1 hypothetical protein [Nocardia pulmonis]MCM6790662.1 hypothetical protein [Nocardia sp. CDC159]
MTTVPTARRRVFDIAVQVLIALASLAVTIFFVYLLLHQHPAERSHPSAPTPTHHTAAH